MFTKNDNVDRRAGQRSGADAERSEEYGSQAHEPGTGDEVIAFVGKGVEFKGVITYSGTVRIDGHVDGEIHTDGVLVVGQDAIVSARITAGTVISRGHITGDIVAAGRVRLLSPAVQSGSVKAPLLSIEEGVLFNGSLEMAKSEQHQDTRSSGGGSVTPIRVSSTMKTG